MIKTKKLVYGQAQVNNRIEDALMKITLSSTGPDLFMTMRIITGPAPDRPVAVLRGSSRDSVKG